MQFIIWPPNPRQNWDHTLTNSTQRKVFQLVASWLWHVLDEDQWAALLYYQGHLQSSICWGSGNLFSWTPPGHYRETFTAGKKFHTGMGDKKWFQVCSPQVQSHKFNYTPIRAQRLPPWGLETLLPVESTKFLGLWWDSHLSFKKHISMLKTQC